MSSRGHATRTRRRGSLARGATGLAALVLVLAHGARLDAQPIHGGGYDLRLFRPAVDSRGQFSVDGTDIPGAWDVAFGLVVDYGRGLARIGAGGANGAPDRALVDNYFTGTLFANVGLLNWLVVGLQLPVVLVGGPGDAALNVANYAPPTRGLSLQGASDLALDVKLRLVRSERSRVGLALRLQASVPFGNSSAWAGEPGVALWPTVVFEWRPVREFRLDVNAGYRGFTGRGATVGTGPAYAPALTAGVGASVRVLPALELAAETYAANYTRALGQPDALPWEAVGGIKVFVQRNSYLMAGAGTRVPFGNALAAADLRAFVGMVFEPSIGDTDGDGYRDDVDRCPTQPEDFDGYQDEDGCPDPDNDHDSIPDVRDACPNVPEDRDGDHDEDGCPETGEGDRDGDGIADRVDQCPDQPEDRDGFEDQDGCPDPDNDRDGILDTDDLCPNEAEDRDGFEDQNGCPDPDNDHDRIPDTRDRCPNEPESYNGLDDDDGCPDNGGATLEDSRIFTLAPITFETRSARIRAESLPTVEAVARVILAHPELDLLEVQGHADERGDDAANVSLTRDRAASVVRALIERGVAPGRLHSSGYGERCRFGYAGPREPPRDNAVCQHGGPRWCHSERAWRLDRRVVFQVLRTHGAALHVRVACPEGEDLIPADDRAYHVGEAR